MAPRPPTTFALPGSTTAVVTPCAAVSSSPSSSGLIPSSARTWGVTGSVLSLVSLPSQPTPSSWTPRCVWASSIPGKAN